MLALEVLIGELLTVDRATTSALSAKEIHISPHVQFKLREGPGPRKAMWENGSGEGGAI